MPGPQHIRRVFIRYMRVRMPVAHKGEWRPKQWASKTTKAAPGANSKNNIGVFLFLYIYIILLGSLKFIKFTLNFPIPQKESESARTPENDSSQKKRSHN